MPRRASGSASRVAKLVMRASAREVSMSRRQGSRLDTRRAPGCSRQMRPGRRSRARLFYAAAALGLLASVASPSPVAATIEEQRARLPPPAECPDDVEGTWMAIRYEEHYSPPEWYN